MTDPPCLSRIPPAQQSYKHNIKGNDGRGGGAVVHCKYLLSCYNTTFVKVTEFVKNAADKLRYEGTEEVEVEESRFSQFPDKKQTVVHSEYNALSKKVLLNYRSLYKNMIRYYQL